MALVVELQRANMKRKHDDISTLASYPYQPSVIGDIWRDAEKLIKQQSGAYYATASTESGPPDVSSGIH